MEQLAVICQSTDTPPIKCTGLSLDLDSVSISSSAWAMAGTATAKRTSSELAKHPYFGFSPSLRAVAQPQQTSLFATAAYRLVSGSHCLHLLMKRLKSCRVKLHSGNTRALAIEFGFLFENVDKILLSLEFSVCLKVCRGSRKLLTPVSSLPVQRPVAHNLSDNFRRLVGLVIPQEGSLRARDLWPYVWLGRGHVVRLPAPG